MKKEPFLALIEGGKEADGRLFRKLMERPQDCEWPEFVALIEHFGHRLDFSDKMALVIHRYRRYPGKLGLERRLLLSVLEGDKAVQIPAVGIAGVL